jgi:hypothetical protein
MMWPCSLSGNRPATAAEIPPDHQARIRFRLRELNPVEKRIPVSP